MQNVIQVLGRPKTGILTFAFWTLHFALLFLIVLGAAPAAKRSPQAQKISIATHLDKTALWVGDPLIYTIRIIHDSDIEFIQENLKKENFSLAPFAVRALALQQGQWGENKKLLEIQLFLSTYEIGKTELTIPSFSLYYFIREPGLVSKASPAQTVQVPATKVGLRSTLGAGQPKLRDSKPIASTDPVLASIALLLGVSGIVLLVLRSGRRAWTVLHGERSSRRRVSPKARDKFAQEGLSRIRATGGQSPEGSPQFYMEVSKFLRAYLAQWQEIEAASLTPEEIETALNKAGQNGYVAQEIRKILEQCDFVRYGKKGPEAGTERRSELLEALEKVVAQARN